MRHISLLLLAVIACVAAQAATRTSPPVYGVITTATAFRGQALVTRAITATVAKGDQEIVVTGLPETIVPTSLYATSGPHVTIRSVRYQVTALRASPNAQVREYQSRIDRYSMELQKIESDLGVLEARGNYLDKLENTTAPANGKGATAPDTVARNTRFMFAQRQEIARKWLNLSMRQDNLSSEIRYWQRRMSEVRYGRAKSQREAILYLGADRAGTVKFTLSYLVNGVNWTPTYSAYLNATHSNMMIEYVAVVTQRSGEDWRNVALTLSTTRPTLIADAATLSPFWINLTPENQAANVTSISSAQTFNETINVTQSTVNGNDYTVYLSHTGKPKAQANVGQVSQSTGMHNNVLAARMQNIELSASDDVVEAARKSAVPISELLSVSYPIAAKVSIPSRSDQQMFRITKLYLPVKFYYTATPLLSDCIYQSADATNSSKYALLPGPYNAYLDGQFAGRGQLKLVARGQNFTVGFGADTELRVARELVSKKTEVNGGNNIATLTYTLKLLNFTNHPVPVRVWDRIPRTPDESVIITLGETTPALSEDDGYQEDDLPVGLLRWDVTVPAQAMGTKTMKLDYTFTIEYDKSYVFTDLPPELIQLMRDEYQATRDRQKK